MTPEKRLELKTQLADHGLTVLLTRDYKALLLQLARLSQFERMLIQAAAGNPVVEFTVHHVRKKQAAMAELEGI